MLDFRKKKFYNLSTLIIIKKKFALLGNIVNFPNKMFLILIYILNLTQLEN